MLNKNDVLPLYVQLKRLLREEILTGLYKDGDIIPSEIQMSQKYGITRTTVRRAIADLVNDGLLSQVHGKGTYVCLKEIRYNIWNFGGFTDYITKKDEKPHSIVINKEIIEFGNRKYLVIQRGRGVIKGNDLIFLTMDTSKIPLDIFPGLEDYDFSINSIYQVMRTVYGVYPKRAELSMNSVISDSLMRKTFGLKKDMPLLLAMGNVHDNANRIIENVSVVYGPNIEFKVVTNMDI
jgi:GntR family transcriptional regulator